MSTNPTIDTVARATSTEQATPKPRSIRNTGTLKPCDRCRAQHLKCVYTSETCQRCERSGHECIRTRKGIQFRRTSISAFNGHKPSSTRSSRSSVASTALISQKQAPKTVISNGRLDGRGEDGVFGAHRDLDMLAGEHEHVSRTVSAFATDDLATSTLNGEQEMEVSDPHETFQVVSTISPYATLTSTPLSASTRMVGSDVFSISSSYATARHERPTKPSSRHILNDLVKQPSSQIVQNMDLYIETILLRYFHDELAPWFDLCDPDCHFATVIPQRAREPGALRNALLTISARSLARNKRFRNSEGTVQWNGRLLPQLTEDFAVPYHNKCIRDLLQLSMQPRNLHDDSLLAAVIALRTDEEFGVSTEDDEDQQLFLKIASIFIDAQIPPSIVLPHSSPRVFLSVPDVNGVAQPNDAHYQSPAAHSTATDAESDLGASGLRQACFWTAFRQELHASFLRKQPVRFPLARCAAFRQLTPATDASWANRMVTFCADVLEFCYGSESSDGIVVPAYNDEQRWRQLRDHEENLCSLLPATFAPTYCMQPDVNSRISFPEIWYLEPCHVSGTTYIELARLLLGIFNPTRPPLGHGFIAATSAFISSSKQILFRLCGIALSNSHCPPSLINACIGISIFGEHFDEPQQQDALLEVLAIMADRHAYPTRQIANSLKRAWGRDELTFDKVNSPTLTHHRVSG